VDEKKERAARALLGLVRKPKKLLLQNCLLEERKGPNKKGGWERNRGREGKVAGGEIQKRINACEWVKKSAIPLQGKSGKKEQKKNGPSHKKKHI